MKRGCLVAGVVGVAALGCFLAYLLVARNRLIVRNASGVPVKSVTLILQDTSGQVVARGEIPRLAHGESYTIRHARNDSQASLRFTFKGAQREHKQPYIDLWTGEGWVFEIQPDGTVASGYDYPNFPLGK